jgi:hypothetical protein
VAGRTLILPDQMVPGVTPIPKGGRFSRLVRVSLRNVVFCQSRFLNNCARTAAGALLQCGGDRYRFE